MTDAWSARTRADGISRATVSSGACRDVLSVSPTTPHSGFQPRNFVPRSWHSGTPLSSQIATGPYGGPGSRYGITMDRSRPCAHERLTPKTPLSGDDACRRSVQQLHCPGLGQVVAAERVDCG